MIARPRDRDLTGAALEDFVTRLAGRPEGWAHPVRHDPGERVYEALLRDNPPAAPRRRGRALRPARSAGA